MSRFSVEIFMSHSAEKFRRAPLQCVTNLGNRKTLCFTGLCHDISQKILSRSTENLCRGTILCCVSEKFWQRKSFWIRGKWSYQDFPSKKFSLTVPKNAVGESFSLSLISCIQKNLDERDGGWGRVSRFSVEIFFSLSAEKFRRETL